MYGDVLTSCTLLCHDDVLREWSFGNGRGVGGFSFGLLSFGPPMQGSNLLWATPFSYSNMQAFH